MDFAPFIHTFSYGVALFIAGNLVSVPFGFVIGFQEARKRPLGPQAVWLLDVVDGVLECATWAAILVYLLRHEADSPIAVAAGAVAIALVATALTLRVMRLDSLRKWLEIAVVSATACTAALLVA